MTPAATPEALVEALAETIHQSLHPGGNYQMARASQSPGWMASDSLAEELIAGPLAPVLADLQRQVEAINDLEKNVNGLEADLQRVTAERDEAHRMRRWNIDRTGDGEVLVCRGYHDKGEDCDHERFVPEERLATATAENDRLRAELANRGGPCVYCDLSREDWAKCRSGFPGCGRADDAMLCPHYGAEIEANDRADTATAEAASLRAENEKLKQEIAAIRTELDALVQEVLRNG